MAVPSNTLQTYQGLNSNREDLVDAIYRVAQTKVPFTARIPKISAEATLHEWQLEDLADAVSNNQNIEGDDSTADAALLTTRGTNYCEISKKVAQVSGTQERVNKAGKGSEMNHQVAAKSVELTRDIEKSALANKAKSAGTASAARITAGIESWIATNTSEGATATSATGDGTDARVAGTARAFTESLLKGVLASIADAGGDPNLVMVGSFNKQAMSAFTGNGITRNVQANANALDTAIDIYVSDFGTLEVVYSPFQNAASALVVDTNMFAMAMLRGFETSDLAKTGDSMRKQVITEWALEARNENSSGAVYDLTVA